MEETTDIKLNFTRVMEILGQTAKYFGCTGIQPSCLCCEDFYDFLQ